MVLQLAKKVFSLAPFLDSPMRCVRFEHGLQDQIVKSSWMDYGATFVCNLQCAVLDWGFAYLFDGDEEPASADDGTAAAGAAALGGGFAEPAPLPAALPAVAPPALAPASVTFKARTSRFGQ